MDIKEIKTKIDSITKLGDIRKLAKEIKTDQKLSLELWKTGGYKERLLAILIMDKKKIDKELIDELDVDMQKHGEDEMLQLMDWLFANQLSKSKKLISLIESWKNDSSPLKRRTFWYYQARLRWTGNTEHENTLELLDEIEKNIEDEVEIVRWTMNFTAGWIGIYDEEYRDRCIKIGEKTGLYKDEVVSKGCTPSYLPEFIRIEVGKREK